MMEMTAQDWADLGIPQYEPTLSYQSAPEWLVAAMDSGSQPIDEMAFNAISNADAAQESGYDGFGNVPGNTQTTSSENGYDKSLEDGISASWREKLAADLATESKAKSLDEILKSYGINDKVAASLIQVGGGMLAGAAKGQMQQKAWDREDALIAKERARRDANSKPGQVYSMNFKPKQTGLLATAK